MDTFQYESYFHFWMIFTVLLFLICTKVFECPSNATPISLSLIWILNSLCISEPSQWNSEISLNFSLWNFEFSLLNFLIQPPTMKKGNPDLYRHSLLKFIKHHPFQNYEQNLHKLYVRFDNVKMSWKFSPNITVFS